MVQYNAEYVCGPKEYIHLERSTSTDRSMSRNVLSGKFLGDWLFMLDADHTFEPDILRRLLSFFETYGLDVLTGIYVSKSPPYPPLIQWRDQGDWHIISEWSPKAQLIQIGRAGAGCLLVRRRVFERIYHELHEEPFAYNNNFSEDFSFFARLEQLGIKAYCACKVACEHLTLTKLTIDDFNPNEMKLYSPNTPVPTALEKTCASQ